MGLFFPLPGAAAGAATAAGEPPACLAFPPLVGVGVAEPLPPLPPFEALGAAGDAALPLPGENKYGMTPQGR